MARAGSIGTRASAAVAAAALIMGVGGGFALGRTTGGDSGEDDSGHEPGSIEAIAEELAAGQASDRAALATELTVAGRTAHDQLGQVLRSMAPTVADVAPAPEAPAASAEDAASWAAGADQAVEALAAVPEGTSEFNVTRQALLGSAIMLSDAATELADVLSAPSPSPEALEQVATQRNAAVQLWQAGAGALDGLVVEAGQEHVHLFLDPSGDPDAVPREFQEPEAP